MVNLRLHLVSLSLFLSPLCSVRRSYAVQVHIDFNRLWKLLLFNVVYLNHVSLPVILSRESLAACSRVVASSNGTVELLLLLVPVIDVSLQMSLGAKPLAAAIIRALVVFAMVSLMMPMVKGDKKLARLKRWWWKRRVILEFMRLIKRLVTTRLIASVGSGPGGMTASARVRGRAVSEIRTSHRLGGGGI